EFSWETIKGFVQRRVNHHHIVNDGIRDVFKIDVEMEEIETEISRLSLKLESLRLEKEEMNV
ncbi:hypothetical protein FRX31_017764, partial [Thalictrum thalictroides]